MAARKITLVRSVLSLGYTRLCVRRARLFGNTRISSHIFIPHYDRFIRTAPTSQRFQKKTPAVSNVDEELDEEEEEEDEDYEEDSKHRPRQRKTSGFPLPATNTKVPPWRRKRDRDFEDTDHGVPEVPTRPPPRKPRVQKVEEVVDEQTLREREARKLKRLKKTARIQKTTAILHGRKHMCTELERYAQRGDLYKTLELFGRLQTSGFRLDRFVYNQILLACARAPGSRVSSVYKYYVQMKKAGKKPDLHTYHHILNCYAVGKHSTRDKFIERIDRILQDMERYQIDPTVATYNLLLKAYLNHDSQDPTRIYELLHKMKLKGFHPDASTFVTWMTAVANQGRSESKGDKTERSKRSEPVKLERIFKIWEVMKANRVSPDIRAYNVFLQLCTEGGPSDRGIVFEVYDEMIKGESGVRPDLYTYDILFNACAKQQRLDRAEALLKQLLAGQKDLERQLRLDIYVCNSILRAACGAAVELKRLKGAKKENVSDRIHKLQSQVLQLAKEEGLQYNIHTHVYLASLFGKLGDMAMVKSYHDKVMRAIREGERANSKVFLDLLNAYVDLKVPATELCESAVELRSKMEEYQIPADEALGRQFKSVFLQANRRDLVLETIQNETAKNVPKEEKKKEQDTD